MAEFQKKRKWQGLLYSKAVLVVLLFLVVVAIISIVNTVPKTLEASRNRALAEREYKALEAQEGALRSKIDRLNTVEGIEENVRDKFRVVKEGEELVVIVDGPAKEIEATASDENSFRSFLEKLFRMRD